MTTQTPTTPTCPADNGAGTTCGKTPTLFENGQWVHPGGHMFVPAGFLDDTSDSPLLASDPAPSAVSTNDIAAEVGRAASEALDALTHDDREAYSDEHTYAVAGKAALAALAVCAGHGDPHRGRDPLEGAIAAMDQQAWDAGILEAGQESAEAANIRSVIAAHDAKVRATVLAELAALARNGETKAAVSYDRGYDAETEATYV